MFPEMTAPENQRHQSGGTRRAPGRNLRSALIITVAAAVAFAASTYAVVKSDLSTSAAELAAVTALLTFGVMIYGLLKTLLALVESASERRREARAATERRHGERTGRPE